MPRYLVLCLLYMLFLAHSLLAQEKGLPKLLLLQINNIENKPQLAYLESSLTDALRQKLKENYVFQEPATEAFETYLKENYYQPADFHTETVSLKLGLELRQQVVISGKFRSETTKDKFGSEILHTSIRIFDIPQKKVIAEINETSPINNNLFNAIDRIADRVVKEAATVLPDKNTWKQKGYVEKREVVYFQRWQLGMRGGVAFYNGGYNNYYSPEQPVLSALLRAHAVFLHPSLFWQAGVDIQRHTLKDNSGTVLGDMGLNLNTTNYHLMGHIGYEIALSGPIRLEPRLGGGVTYQTNQVSGSVSQTLTNSIALTAVGVDFAYQVTKNMALVLSNNALQQWEAGQLSQIYLASLGVNFSF